MSLHSLARLFKPQSIAALWGDCGTDGAGGLILRNLLEAGFAGPVMPVVAPGKGPEGVTAYADVDSLPTAPDLVLVCAPQADLPAVIGKLGQRGAAGVVLLARRHGGAAPAPPDGDVAAAVRAAGMRMLGPDCFGLLVPGIRLNASIAPEAPRPGRVAFIARSTSVCATVFDWVRSQDIGFSHFIGIGRSPDLDFGEIVDYLGSDAGTRSILMVIDEVRDGRRFLSAARAASRNKPVLAIRIGSGSNAEAAGGGAPFADPDAVYDAVFRRAGMLRVDDLHEMFMALEILARARPLHSDSLAIIGNGRGIGMTAAAELARRGGRVAVLPERTLARLRDLPHGAPAPGDPVDLGADADGERYARAADAVLGDGGARSLLVTYAPSALSSPTEVAKAVIGAAKARRTTILTCWAGQDRVGAARHLLREAGLPSYDTPGDAVRAYSNLLDFRRSQELLMETPHSVLDHIAPDAKAVRRFIDKMTAEGRRVLGEPDAKGVLAAYGIQAVESWTAHTPADAARIARRIGGPVAVKIHSSDIRNKSAFGGVALDLSGAAEVEHAAQRMLDRVAAAVPAARLDGFIVQPMMRRPGAQEIMIGVVTDPVFGPLILFGHGGTGAAVINDWSIALPPLNMSLARELIERTRVFRLLRGYHGRVPADLDAICLALVKISQLVVDMPDIFELDINPLLADASGAIALDARMVIARPRPGASRLAIRPYPQELEEVAVLPDGERILLRPIRPEDEPNHHELVSRMASDDLRLRFFTVVNDLPHSEMARFTQIDYEREMAFIAVPAGAPWRETLGVGRCVADGDNDTAEFALLVRSDRKRGGIGRLLLDKMVRYCRARGTRRVVGEVLAENTAMLRLSESLGFRRQRRLDGGIVEVELDLGEPAAPGR